MKAFQRVLVVSLVAALGTAVLAYRKESAAVAEAESQLSELRRRSEQLAPIMERIEAYQRFLVLRENKTAVIGSLRSPSRSASIVRPDLLRRLSLAMASSVKIERLEVRSSSLEVSGRVDTAESLEGWGGDLKDDRLLGTIACATSQTESQRGLWDYSRVCGDKGA